nr:inactive rhomboid-related protein 2-like [Cherax quadricarinatus]
MSPQGRSDKYEPINWHEIFQRIDSDGDGYILRSELKKYLLNTPVSEVPLSDDMVDSMLYHVDYNNDGFINLQEFYSLVCIPYLFGRSVVPRTLLKTSFPFCPRSKYLHGDLTNFCRIFLNALGFCIVGYLCPMQCHGEYRTFSPVPRSSPLIYDPFGRLEPFGGSSRKCFFYAGYVHLLSNVVVALFVGVPLEMVHKWWRLLILYVAGVLAGSLAASMFDPHSYLVGASGGCYALIAAHLANIIINWAEMPLNWARLLVLITLMVTDIGVFAYMTLTKTTTRI